MLESWWTPWKDEKVVLVLSESSLSCTLRVNLQCSPSHLSLLQLRRKYSSCLSSVIFQIMLVTTFHNASALNIFLAIVSERENFLIVTDNHKDLSCMVQEQWAKVSCISCRFDGYSLYSFNSPPHSPCRIVLHCICFGIRYIHNGPLWLHIAVSPVSSAPACKVSRTNSM